MPGDRHPQGTNVTTARRQKTHRSPGDMITPDESTRARVAGPVLVIEVEFAGWTQSGRMRAAAYQGLRTDKDPADVIRET